MRVNNWSVHKFGGTSVGNFERYKMTSQILQKEKCTPQMAVVVSAMKGVTDALIHLVHLAEAQNKEWMQKHEALKEQHRSTLDKLCSSGLFIETWAAIERDFEHIYEILKGVALLRKASQEVFELTSGLGEVWSAQILNSHLKSLGKSSTWLDARSILEVNADSYSVEVLWENSQRKLDEHIKNVSEDFLIITGFVASTPKGVATTLKRNGSDYSASIFAYLFKTSELVIWTDVDGVLSADPRLVPEAQVLPEISYQEVIELAYFGAKVVHPGTMIPAMKMGIPIYIKNSFNPYFPGTKICQAPKSELGKIVRGFSIIENMALFNLEGTGMVGIPGVAEKLFGSLRSEKINVILISQASSEHSICFALSGADAEKAQATLENTFYVELKTGAIDKVEVTKEVTILAAVGDGMSQSPGVAGKFLSALGNSGVNVRAIAQGSSERNISVVIDQVDGRKALRAVHASFYLSAYTLSLGVIGTGLIGKTFIRQLKGQLEILKKHKNIDIQIRATADSKSMTLFDLSPATPQEIEPLDFEKLLNHVGAAHLPHFVLIESSASSELPRKYEEWLKKGFHIITPNKKGLSSDYELYKQIKSASEKYNRQYLYSTNVGAGLPFLRTIKEMIMTGDQIESIEAVLSGTLSFIFNNLKDSFADQVREAMKLGFTEPDPRDDLSGMDVLRKMLIITREMGFDYQNITPENLVPKELRSISKEEFIQRLDEIKIKTPPNQILRYVAEWKNNNISVGLKSLPLDHPMAALKYADNILIIKSARYKTQPLVIQGPGAGPDVTAAGVFSDLLRLVASLGANL